MAYEQVGRVTGNTIIEFWKRSTDLGVDGKPQEVLQDYNTGSTYYCVDTGATFAWHIDEWFPA